MPLSVTNIIRLLVALKSLNNSLPIPSFYDLLAQLVEQYTFNVWVLGSSPRGITRVRRMVIIAQLVRASVCGAEGRGFKSH